MKLGGERYCGDSFWSLRLLSCSTFSNPVPMVCGHSRASIRKFGGKRYWGDRFLSASLPGPYHGVGFSLDISSLLLGFLFCFPGVVRES